MISPERRKADIHRTISLNPTKVTIKGTKRTIENGKEIVERLRPRDITVRIFPVSRINSTLISEHHHTAKTAHSYGMLAHEDAGLDDTTVTWEDFESAYGKMRIEDVYPQIVRGVLCGYQVILERIT